MAAPDGKARNAWHGHFEPKRVPEGVWMRCDGCGATLFRKQVIENLNVCPECDHHFPIAAMDRVDQLLVEALKRLEPVLREQHRITLELERALERRADRRLVIDHQDTHRVRS